MPDPFRLAVFDMDGTLIDSKAVIVQAMALGFAAVGLPRPAEEAILSIIGLSLPEAMRALVPRAAEATIAALAQAYRAAFVAMRAQAGAEASAPLYPGARAALDRLAARGDVALAVATGKARRGLDHALHVHGLTGRFASLHCADGHPSKPHPSMLHACVADTGVPAHRAVMIGDTEFDIAMGRAAGMATVAVSWGYHPVPRLRAAGATIVIDRFDQLEDALQALWTETAR